VPYLSIPVSGIEALESARDPRTVRAMALVVEHEAKLSGSVEALAAETGQAPRFRMLAYTGAEITRAYGKAIGDLSGIHVPEKLPILLNHDENAVVGYADKAEVTARGLELSGPIIDSEPAGQRVVNLSRKGFPLTASIGFRIEHVERVEEGKTARCNGRDVAGPAAIWRKGALFESSFVTANPADKNTSATALKNEAPMTPDEFLKASPDAVKAWKDEAAKAERESLMGRLDAMLKAITDRPAFVLEQFKAGADVTAAKAALADVLVEELKQVKVAPPQKPAKDPTLEALKQKAGNPGMGFDGNAREQAAGENLANLSPEERAKADLAANPELGVSVEALASFYRKEARGLIKPNLVTRVAAAMAGEA
jgi:phage head maturation protease